MMIAYPNLELLEYKVRDMYNHNFELKALFVQKREHAYQCLDFDTFVFPQVWGSTATGFDVTPDGEPCFGGDMLTKAYTTVFHEKVTDQYFVFFNNELCYKVDNANEHFLKDLNDHNLLPLSRALRAY